MAFHDSGQQKTEAPTPRRLQEARRKGQVAKSRDFSASAILLVGVLLGSLVFNTVFREWERWAAWYFGRCFWLGVEGQGLLRVLFDSFWFFLGMLLPFALIFLGAALSVHLLQTGLVFSPAVVAPQLERLNPLNGLRRMLSLRSLVELAKGIFKVIVVAAVSYSVVKANLPVLLMVFTRAPGAAFGTVAGAVLKVLAAAGGAYLALSLGDLLYQRWEYIRGLRMTKQEVKEELKHTEGDPLVRSWQRRRQRQIAMNLIRAEVPRATVVITNPTHLAVALRYEEKEMEAPVVTAKGAGDLARQIARLAAGHNVPVVRNPEVARALYRDVEIGRPIPVELYRAVAEILAYVYRLKGKKIV
mgnify:CR=1 FL=1